MDGRCVAASAAPLRSGSLVGQSARLIIEGSWVQVPPGPCTPRRHRRGVCVNFPEGLPPLCPPRYVLGPSWKRCGTTGSVNGRVAQLVRALLSHSRGPGFESLRAHAVTHGEKRKAGDLTIIGLSCLSAGGAGLRFVARSRAWSRHVHRQRPRNARGGPDRATPGAPGR